MQIQTDIQLIEQARAGNSQSLEELLTRYKPLATKISRQYFLAGQDSDDIYQEAMIGLFKAYQSYNNSTEFNSFAKLCINRQIQSAVKMANRQKNKALNEYISLNNQGGFDLESENDDDEVLIFILPSKDPLPDDTLISKENIELIKKEIVNRLSTLEKSVLTLYLRGKSYKEMADSLQKTPKAIENALVRIKSKLSFLNKN